MSIDSPSTTTTQPSTPDRHEFLLPTGYETRETTPFDCALALADALDQKPTTAATFHPATIVGDIDIRNLDARIFHLLGSWKLPEYYTSNAGRGSKWVNPNYHDRARYADVAVRCECGTLIIRSETVAGESLIPGENEHAPDCRRSWRHRTLARLFERREEIATEMLALGHDINDLTPRLGIQETSNLAPYVDTPTFDVDAHKARARQRIANTAAELLTRHPPADVGAVYGTGAKFITQVVNRLTDTTADECYHERNAREHEQQLDAYLADVRRVADRDDSPGRLTMPTYDERGRWSKSTVYTQFDCGWAGILERAGVIDGEQ